MILKRARHRRSIKDFFLNTNLIVKNEIREQRENQFKEL